jgi:PAS domain S-box-containing protein
MESAQADYNQAMASPRHGLELARRTHGVRLVIDAIPALAWSARADGSADFFNQRWLEYTGLSAEQARDWGWTDALHADDVNGLVDYWRSVLAAGKPGEIEARLRRFDGVHRWFIFRATPSFDNDGKVVKWFGTNTDIEDRKRAESLLAGENRVLEMTAKGNSLESILETLCRVVEQTADGCYCSVILIDPTGSTIEQAIAPSLPSTYNNRFPGLAVDREGGPCTEAALRKKQVIVPDVVADTRWDTYGWRKDALAHGLKACWSTTILASNGLVLGAFAIYWRESRSPSEQDQKIIGQITHLAAVAIERKRNEAALQQSEERFRVIVDTIPGLVFTLNTAGEIELLNRQVLEYFGKTAEELKNWATSDAVHPDDLPRVIEVWRRSIETGQPYVLELRQRRADGVYRWFQSRAFPARNTEGRITGWYMLLTVLRNARVSTGPATRVDGRLGGDWRRSPSCARVAHAAGGRTHLQRDACGYPGRAHQKGLLRPERRVRVQPGARCRGVKYRVHRPRLAVSRHPSRPLPERNTLGRGCAVHRYPWRGDVAHSATRGTNPTNRSRPVIMGVRDSVRDLHRASRARCANDVRLHPTSGDRYSSNVRELHPGCGVRGRLAHFDSHDARWPHAACDRLLQFDVGTLHNDPRVDLEPRRTS